MSTSPAESKEVVFHSITTTAGDAFLCSSELSLLRGMEKARSFLIPVGCRGGGCGVCKIKVISGDFDRKVMSKKHISDEDNTSGHVLACRIFPRSNMVILVS